MSIWAVNWALNEQLPSPTSKLLLVALANFANDEDEAWPHLETLESMVGVSKRTVLRGLRELCDGGWISRLQGFADGPRGGLVKVNSVYRLNLPETVTRRCGHGADRPGQLRETPSQVRSDTGDTTVPSVNKSPSQVRGDMDVTTVDRSDTGDTTVVTLVTPLYKEEPSVEPSDLTPLPPTPPPSMLVDGSGGVGSGPESDPDVEDSRGGVGLPAAGSAPAGGRAVSPNPAGGVVPVGRDVAADWALIRHALPEPMQVLDDDGVAVVAPLLRKRLDAGWTAADLRAHLAANPVPDRVRHLAGLVAHRLGKLPPEGAPPKSSSRWRIPDPPSTPLRPEERSPVAVRAEAARAEAIRTGSPDAGRSRAWWLMRELNADKKAAEGTSGS
jgi:hypothetical protein